MKMFHPNGLRTLVDRWTLDIINLKAE